MSLPGTERKLSYDRRRALRRSAPELAAYHWNGTEPRQNEVRDISSTGVYLLTRETWVPGEMISLTLQRRGPLEGDLERRVMVQARAVRRDEYGVGLSFVFPAGVDLRLWDSPLMVGSERFEPEDVLREFRVAGALAFLARLAPAAAPELGKLLHEGLSNYRMASAAEIALSAERMLALRPDAERMRAMPHLVMHIMENGSWADSETMVQYWAGLLATASTPEGTDETNTLYTSLLSQLTSPHLRLLKTACTRGSKYFFSFDRMAARPVTLSARELMETTGSRDLIRIHRDLELMAELGLLVVTVRSVSFAPMQGTDIAATSLGLQLYARCNGYADQLPSFYHVPARAASELETFGGGAAGEPAAPVQV